MGVKIIEIIVDIGSRIKNIRRENKFTQAKLATSLNVTRQAISGWENNKSTPDLEIIINLAIIFNMSLDELIFGDIDVKELRKKIIELKSENSSAKFNVTPFNLDAYVLADIRDDRGRYSQNEI